ncbi:MAG: PaaI family thioesterase [Haloarculaceae archaeon]
MSDTDESDAPADRAAEEFFRDGTFNDWIGLAVEEYGEGEVVVSVDCEEFKQNPGGVLHGGVTATLIDVSAGMAIGSTFEEPRGTMATTNLDVTFLRPVTDTAYASATVVRVGSSNAVAHVEVESTDPDGERKDVAIGTVTYQHTR